MVTIPKHNKPKQSQAYNASIIAISGIFFIVIITDTKTAANALNLRAENPTLSVLKLLIKLFAIFLIF
jgi:hypothetical protein